MNNIKKFQFHSPTTILISGVSQSGKSTWIEKVINFNDQLFDTPPKKIIYCYSAYQNLFDRIKNKVNLFQGIPSLEEICLPNKEHVLLILDDMLDQLSRDIVNIFTVSSHHCNISCIFVTQNIFFKNPHLRSISLNSHYIVTFRQPRDLNQIQVLGRQILPHKSKVFLKIYSEATKKKYNYILINIHPANELHTSIHENIFPNEIETIYFE